ncbi:MAG TPA: GDP-mannose 4,6-dehydratase [Bryobacteraceae bacterium]|jgi:CDP-paratose 2-epimerase|nr:GDP-mannose 4,6-dehydratase [Bryobacteraceae bacterium]
MNRAKASENVPRAGFVEWFRPGEYDRVESVIEKTLALGIREIRTAICWADWHTSEGNGWYAWLLPRLAAQVNVLPCFLYTPPSLGIAPKFSSPPRVPKSYADFLDVVITRFGNLFEWMELWNRPNHPSEWDSRMDPDWKIFSEMIGGAAYWIHERGKKAVLSGPWPSNPQWFELMHERGVLRYIDAVGVQAFPSSPEVAWRGWTQEVGDIRTLFAELGLNPEIWITQAGFSTWRGDEQAQVRAFAEALNAPVDRVYWQELFDKVPASANPDSPHSDERDYHYGLLRADSSPKLLFRLWSEGGLKSVKESARFVRNSKSDIPSKRVLITGGAGFIGTNLADRLLSEGHKVTIYDDLSRAGVKQNIAWLREKHADRLRVEIGDVRDAARLKTAVHSASTVYHFAAQVAVTTSLLEPRHDYEVNLGGTLNVLEAIRACDNPPPLLFTSTNKVYGALSDLPLEKNCTRYQPLDTAMRSGVSEEHSLDFHSPYGCSKGAADQYVLDYARSFGLPAVVFRMSCIYGLHQMGTEDQGWVAHFLIRAIKGLPIVICGDGMQVRDVLFVDDLVDAMMLAQANSRTLSGQAFNIGGGLGNTISLIELLDLIANLHGHAPEIQKTDWRVGDQRYYVSDTRKFRAATGWAPRISVREGVRRLYEWLLTGEDEDTPILARGAHAVLAR